ncbi:MAG: dihydropyrimidinase [Clostridiales bacterium]|nr:dihydropyrimidinase [Clostridiales bacterium]
MDLIIKNGTIVTEKEMFKADIAVKDGKIALIGTDLSDIPAEKVVDATGKLVLPGAIDAHTHLSFPFGGTVSSDSYFAGTRAAACGGTTTVFDYTNQNFGEKLVDAVKRREAQAAEEGVAVDYGLHIGIKDPSGDLLDSMQEAIEYGVSSFKVFMVYDFGVSDGVFYKVLEKAKQYGALIAVHAENNEMVNLLVERYASEGKLSPWYHYASRPEFVEGEADRRAIAWAKSLNTALYIVHLADKEGVEAVTQAKDEGYEIYAETCPQYLHFTDEVFKREDGRNFVCSPPMKGQESQDALWEAIKRGDIDTIATDHCPFQQSEKDWGKDDFRKIPNGCAGIENMYPYMLSKANDGVITFQKAVELCSFNPARIFGCEDKGSLSVGKDADIVIYDPEKNFTVHNSNMHSDSDHTIWEGLELHGYPIQTYSRGRLVYDNGEFVGEKGWGKMVKCAARAH